MLNLVEKFSPNSSDFLVASSANILLLDFKAK